MKPKIKKLWVEALRSGKYRQTEGMLKDSKGAYCCLGVLTDLYSKVKKVPFVGKNKYLLPEEVIQWSGLNSDNPSVNCCVYVAGHKLEKEPLSALNDSIGLNFKAIANIIDKEL